MRCTTNSSSTSLLVFSSRTRKNSWPPLNFRPLFATTFPLIAPKPIVRILHASSHRSIKASSLVTGGNQFKGSEVTRSLPSYLRVNASPASLRSRTNKQHPGSVQLTGCRASGQLLASQCLEKAKPDNRAQISNTC